MTTRLEAPAQEPLSSIRQAIAVEGVTRRYAARRRRGEPVVALACDGHHAEVDVGRE